MILSFTEYDIFQKKKDEMIYQKQLLTHQKGDNRSKVLLYPLPYAGETRTIEPAL